MAPRSRKEERGGGGGGQHACLRALVVWSSQRRARLSRSVLMPPDMTPVRVIMVPSSVTT